MSTFSISLPHAARHNPLATAGAALVIDHTQSLSARSDGQSGVAEQADNGLSARADRPFAYPFGKAQTFDHVTERLVEEAGFACAFSTETGMNTGVGPRFAIRRLDPKDVVSRAL